MIPEAEALSDIAITEEEVNQEVTLETLQVKVDALGAQLDWLCENMASLFVFVQQVGSNGGGIRGIMSLLKQGPPQLQAEIKEG